MKGEFLTPDDPRWVQALDVMPHDVYHLPGYATVEAQQEGGEVLAFLAENGASRFFIPLIVREIDPSLTDGAPLFDATCPYGYPGSLLAPGHEPAAREFLPRAIAAFVDGLRQRRIVAAFLRLHPLYPLPAEPLARAGCLVEHGETIFVDLTRAGEEHWRHTRRDHRKDINRARRQGHIARMDESWEQFDTFVEIYHETMGRLGASDSYRFSRDHFRRLRDILGERLHLCVVEIDGHVACAGLVTETCGIVQNHLSGTKTEYLAYSPEKLRVDFLRRWAKERGNRVLHLGGGLGGRADALFAFKSGFSQDRAGFATWRLVADAPSYGALTARWEARRGVPADEMAGFFPAYRKP